MTLHFIILMGILFSILVLIVIITLFYSALFHQNHSKLTKMVEVLRGNDKIMAEKIRSQVHRRFVKAILVLLIFYGFSIVFLYYFAYISPSDNILIYQNIIYYIGLTLVIFALYHIFANLSLNVEYHQWRKILSQYGLNIDRMEIDIPLFIGSRYIKMEILARSWFRKNYSEYQNVYFLPPADHNFFRKQSFYGQTETSVSSISTLHQREKNQIMKDLQIANINIPGYNSTVYSIMFSISIISIYVAFISFELLNLSVSNILKLSSGSIFAFLALLISFISSSITIYYSVRYRRFNEKLVKDILFSHNISYSDENYEQKLLELLETKYPYVDIHQ